MCITSFLKGRDQDQRHEVLALACALVYVLKIFLLSLCAISLWDFVALREDIFYPSTCQLHIITWCYMTLRRYINFILELWKQILPMSVTAIYIDNVENLTFISIEYVSLAGTGPCKSTTLYSNVLLILFPTTATSVWLRSNRVYIHACYYDIWYTYLSLQTYYTLQINYFYSTAQ